MLGAPTSCRHFRQIADTMSALPGKKITRKRFFLKIIYPQGANQ